ncbi:FMN-dependent NADH-azoreductase [Staphylococcus arlettae]|uniref:FMN-dependent NADH-azoreductase n=1 Tax=Staphylococcus arlettae TaxID=29378 RepID=UPI001E3613C8|nr:NAD(P)H-dependent oxidoreductase [Staphylococcus arlettae]MCD8864250.1 NAD(P)H-dependent oxidoreductase [Staphylococcus arlettae]
MKTLIINAHPDYQNETTFSAKLQQLFLQQYQLMCPIEEVEVLNLYQTEIPRIETTQLLKIWEKEGQQQEMTRDEQKIAQRSKALIAQFKAHHRIVIVTPMHNFNITSRLKDYMDNILVPRQTFKYTDTGSVGLMTDDYQALLLQASGSVYTNDDRYTALEFSYHYLKGMFEEIMGFDALHIVRAQDTATTDEATVMQQAANDLTTPLSTMYNI